MKELFKKRFFRIFILFLIFCFVVRWGYRQVKIDGESMISTYSDGETLLIDKILYKFNDPERGDVIVFYDFEEDDFLVKRIIGLPGEKIEVIDGSIYIDGQLWIDKFSNVKLSALLVGIDEIPLINWETGENIYENDNLKYERLAAGEYWAIGDNRQESWYGRVYEDEILGKVKN